MHCDCGGKTKEKSVGLYHYQESGLPNVFLADIRVIECEECGTVLPVIPSILKLHASIAEAIAMKPAMLTGAEMRFLRKQLGLSAVQWASYMKMDKASVSRLENGHNPIGRQTDALIRLLYFRLLEEKENRHISENIADMIADVEQDSEEFGLRVPAGDPSAYTFVAAKELFSSAALR
jgi:putative transcriptional regulator